jgi:hypothetical protein
VDAGQVDHQILDLAECLLATDALPGQMLRFFKCFRRNKNYAKKLITALVFESNVCKQWLHALGQILRFLKMFLPKN